MLVKRRRKKRTEADKKAILKDYNAGIKLDDIMKKHSVSRAGIYFIIDELEKQR